MSTKRPHALAVEPPDLAALFAARLDAVLVDAVHNGSAVLPLDAVLVWPLHEREGTRELVIAEWEASLSAGLRGSRSANPATWPADLPLPLTLGDALAAVKQRRADIAADLAAELERCARALVDPVLVAAVLSRGGALAEDWPWPDGGAGGRALFALIGGAGIGDRDNARVNRVLVRGGGIASTLGIFGRQAWNVACWAEPALNRVSPGFGTEQRNMAERYGQMGGLTVLDGDGNAHRYPAPGMALLYHAEQRVREGLRRPVVAIDAGRSHHNLLTGWRDNPRDGRRHRAAPAELSFEAGRVELMLPGHPVQLTLPMEELAGLSEGAIRLLRDIRGAKGLRHWCALQRLFSVEGGRQGWVRWTLNEHLTAMGYQKNTREDPEKRAEAAAEVELLTRMELVVYDASNIARHRAPLLLVGDRFERLAGSAWRLEGMELRANDLLYAGVRDRDTGKLGSNWWPVPVELAQIDHVRHGYAHALGMILAMRFRWDAGDGRGATRLTGRKLLDLAGIRYTERRAAEAWGKLRRELAELERIEMIAATVWIGDAWTLDGVCCLSPAAWIEDRTARQLHPEEPPMVALPLNGAELRAWRVARAWSRRETARRLDLPATTLDKAEAKPAAPLGPKVTAALASWRAG